MSLVKYAKAAVLAIAVALPAHVVPAFADSKELIFNVFIPQRAPLFSKALKPWAEEVEKVSGGSLKLTVPTSSLAPRPRLFDMVEDGVADIAIAPLAFRQKQLSLYTITNIPLSAPSSKGASKAYWDTHETYFADADQWGNFVPLSLFTLGAPGIISNTEPVQSQADLQGYKMFAAGKEKTQIWKNLGATPVGGGGKPPFEFVSSGVADGASSAFGTAANQGLLEASKSITVVPGGFGGLTPFVLYMNKEVFESLTLAQQTALTSTSGGKLATKIGGIMDKIDKSGVKRFADKGVEVYTASDAFMAEINAASSFVENEWLAKAAAAGVDGSAALDHFKSVASK